MSEELFIQGNEACAKGALKAGCRFFAGYPITPSTEVAETLSRELPKVGGSFVQMEDEIASAGAIIGGSWGGTKSMTATSGPGFSLMQENIGYAFITETPMVIVNVQRGSPSTGQPTRAAQGDMMQARWGSHGDYEPIALSPSSVQEFFDFTIKAFNLSEQFRTPVFVMADEIIGHMREKIIIDDDIEIVARQMPEDKENYLPFRNVENGTNPMPSFGQGFNIHVSGLTHDERGYPSTDDADVHDALVQRLCDKILNNRDKICSVQSKYCEDAETVLVSYGAPVRSVCEAVEKARAEGKKVGYIKIDTPWPFPEEQVKELTKTASNVLVVELNLGQMFYEVDRVLRRDSNVYLMGQIGGTMPTPDEILSKINEIGGN
ncbi:2-oxoacid:acceptor oxidoreductase subunit alpha [uncultured Methanobrevibacter sp.]|uniref:2-oxoacid:acceptor oxidoreductase subunit alpha n=1 Tax=uncultured Methanobrevibacter sp. TaxID=253161 RepID=UPI0025E544D5|nr:2-oxoacid:acceptor oxidoreductase subunit alpha [uncultured Methanobrevibacter sp.]